MSVSVDVESIVQSFMPYIICKLQKRHMRSRVRTWENCINVIVLLLDRTRDREKGQWRCMHA